MQDDPFEQLLRSHRRLEERLADMTRAAADLEAPKAVEFLRDSLAWMDRAVRRHEDDEEQSLFPRLSGRPELAACIATLTAEHRTQERLQRELAAAIPDRARCVDLVGQLNQAYTRHIREEEDHLFPAARAFVDGDDRHALAKEMAARRGR
jgi:hemerythrin-like domain-containing protein